MAQNDAALGIIINTISHSPIWKESLILVTEDDAQNGPDHVDATRTVALAVGPWVKRDAVVSDRYDQLSMLRTIEMLLGFDPMNQRRRPGGADVQHIQRTSRLHALRTDAAVQANGRCRPDPV